MSCLAVPVEAAVEFVLLSAVAASVISLGLSAVVGSMLHRFFPVHPADRAQ